MGRPEVVVVVKVDVELWLVAVVVDGDEAAVVVGWWWREEKCLVVR